MPDCEPPPKSEIVIKVAVTTAEDKRRLAADIIAILRRHGMPAVVVDPKDLDDVD